MPIPLKVLGLGPSIGRSPAAAQKPRQYRNSDAPGHAHTATYHVTTATGLGLLPVMQVLLPWHQIMRSLPPCSLQALIAAVQWVTQDPAARCDAHWKMQNSCKMRVIAGPFLLLIHPPGEL